MFTTFMESWDYLSIDYGGKDTAILRNDRGRFSK